MCHLVRHSSVHCHALLLHVIKVGLGDGYAEVDDRGVLYRRFRFVRRFTGRVTVGFLCWGHVHSLLAVRARHQKPGDGLPRQKCVCFCNLITERNTICYDFFFFELGIESIGYCEWQNKILHVWMHKFSNKGLKSHSSYISINLKSIV